MAFDLLKVELDVLRRHFNTTTTQTEVAVFCAHQVLSEDGRAPRMTEVAEAAGASLSSVSRWMGKYEAQGLVRIEPDPEDDRANRIHQTKKGERFRDAVRAEVIANCRHWRSNEA